MAVTHKADRPRTATLQLEWPLGRGETDLTEITLRRLTGGEVAALQEQMMAGGSEADMLAAFCDQPADVIAQLDADDYLDLKAKVVDFLPRRLREMMEAEAPSS